MLLGSTSVGVKNIDEWWLITSNRDWLNAQNTMESNEDNLFESLRAFPEGGQNNYRGEIMAMYYSLALAITIAEKSKLIKGTTDDFKSYNVHVDQLLANQNVLGFKFNTKL